MIPIDLPIGYKRLSLKMIREKLQKSIGEKKSALSMCKTIFFTGDFTSFISEILACSDQYFIDSTYLALILS